mmetsp:Transcript_13264/g.6500  ORF Transcript_13264/g.6500 Transcript_13264/m.6500 type:complete len:112 (+) Transcript_13264:110-445(+)
MFLEETEISNEEKFDNLAIVGTCKMLEKPYLRLTSTPNSESVRPKKVLRRALRLLKQKWKQHSADWAYISEQLMSIRQDLTVQHVKDKFTVEVYEMNARLALEVHDLAAFV